MSLRLLVSSEDGKNLYTDNNPDDFRVKLNQTIQLEGYWMVGVTEFTTTERNDSGEKPELFIFF